MLKVKSGRCPERGIEYAYIGVEFNLKTEFLNAALVDWDHPRSLPGPTEWNDYDTPDVMETNLDDPRFEADIGIFWL